MIDVNMLDKIQQLDELESIFPLSKVRNFYLKNSNYHIDNLNLYSIVTSHDTFLNSTDYYLYIGCIETHNYVYQAFLRFMSSSRLTCDSCVKFYYTEYVKFALENHIFVTEPEHIHSLSEIQSLLFEKLKLDDTAVEYKTILQNR